MTPDVDVVRPDDSLAALREVMDEKHVRHVPVVDDDDRLVGLVTERDLLRRAAGLEGDVPQSVSDEVSAAVTVRDVMTWSVETIEADEDAATAAAVMLDNKYGCLPVLEQGVLAGILTKADVVRWRRSSTSPGPTVAATFRMLRRVKAWMDAGFSPDGYNVGWNCGRVGGQEVFHAHLHVIPRFRQEPLAGQGIRSHLKSDANRW
jgi:CBS domain-containing membrane protein